LDELSHGDAAARMDRGSVGAWENGADLARGLSPLPMGRGAG
jgi:hypothetical protein